MSGIDKKAKKIHAADIRKNCEIRAEYSAKSKPTAKAAEHFKRKAYEKMNSQNTCNNTECAFHSTKEDCAAKEGCAGYTEEKQASWKKHMMQHFTKGD